MSGVDKELQTVATVPLQERQEREENKEQDTNQEKYREWCREFKRIMTALSTIAPMYKEAQGFYGEIYRKDQASIGPEGRVKPFEELQQNVETVLAQLDSLDPQEVFLVVRPLLDDLAKSADHFLKESQTIGAHEKYCRDLENALHRIETKLKGIQQLPGLIRVFYRGSEKKNIADKDNLEHELITARERRNQTASAFKLSQKCNDWEYELEKKGRERIWQEENGIFVGGINDAIERYEALVSAINADPKIAVEINELYIEQTIRPALSKPKYTCMSTEEKEELLEALHTVVRAGEGAGVNEARNRVDRFLSTAGNKCYVDKLFSKTDQEDVVKKMVALLATDNILGSTVEVGKPLQESDSEWPRTDLAVKYQRTIGGDGTSDRSSSARTDNQSFRAVAARYVTRLGSRYSIGSGDTFEYPDMHYWTALTKSQSLKKVLGDELEHADGVVRGMAMELAMGDTEGRHIDSLAFFTQPEVIRELVVLATTNNSGYRTAHANWALRSLKARPDWPQILKEVSNVYPEFAAVVPILENWDCNDYGRQPELVKQAIALNVALVNDEEAGLTMRSLAADALPTEGKLKFITDLGFITTSEQDKILAAFDILEKQTQADATDGVHTGIDLEIFKSFYNNFIGQFISNHFKRTGGTETTGDQKFLLARLTLVADYVSKKRGDRKILGYVSNIVGEPVFLEPTTSEAQLLDILNAHESCPSLLSDKFIGHNGRAMRANLAKLDLSTDEQLAALATLEERAHNNLPVLQGAIELVARTLNTVTLERAAQLASTAGDLIASGFTDFAAPYANRFLVTDEGLADLRKLSQHLREVGSLVMERILATISFKRLSADKVIEFLKTRGADLAVLGEDEWLWIEKSPEVFFQSESGLNLLLTMRAGYDVGALAPQFEEELGELLLKLQYNRGGSYDRFFETLLDREVELGGKNAAAPEELQINDRNWLALLSAHIGLEVDGVPQPTADAGKKIKELFKQTEVKDFCLQKLQKIWRGYLVNGDKGKLPFSVQLVGKFVEICEGAGPLSQIEALARYINEHGKVLAVLPDTNGGKRKGTAEKIFEGAATMEERMEKERWSGEERAFFYNIAVDVLKVAPSLYSAFLASFKKMSPGQLKHFADEVFPTCRVYLLFLKTVELETKMDGTVTRKEGYDLDLLVKFRAAVKGLIKPGRGNEKINQLREGLSKEIIEMFKNRFGIIKLPEKMNEEYLRSLSNISMYLGNLHGRTPAKENVLGFYLALMINGKWESFRQGEEIKPAEYLAPEKAQEIQGMLEQRKQFNFITAEKLGVAAEVMPKVMRVLEQETSSLVVGEVETIDTKLGNLIKNLQTMEDLDLYPDPLEKETMALLLQHGNKKVSGVVAKLYLSLANPGKALEWSEEEAGLRERIKEIMQRNQIELTAQAVKRHFQDELKPLATISNIGQFVRDSNAESMILELKEFLVPPSEVVAIFKRLGEDFTPASGAMALTEDLSYLANLVVKREDELEKQEKELLTSYLDRIREKVVALHGVYDQIKAKFSSLKQSNMKTGNELLRSKMADIDLSISAQDKQRPILSVMTHDLNSIIENMRECLSCVRQGCNNDTDLTFGDSNKFYLMSKTEEQKKGSIADQIVFFEPVLYADGRKGLAFVVDRLYGTATETVLLNNIEAVMKKYHSIRGLLSEANLSVCITSSAVSSACLSTELLQKKLQEKYGKTVKIEQQALQVDVVDSAFGDHYVEFGGGARTSGNRDTHSIVISN